MKSFKGCLNTLYIPAVLTVTPISFHYSWHQLEVLPFRSSRSNSLWTTYSILDPWWFPEKGLRRTRPCFVLRKRNCCNGDGSTTGGVRGGINGNFWRETVVLLLYEAELEFLASVKSTSLDLSHEHLISTVQSNRYLVWILASGVHIAQFQGFLSSPFTIIRVFTSAVKDWGPSTRYQISLRGNLRAPRCVFQRYSLRLSLASPPFKYMR